MRRRRRCFNSQSLRLRNYIIFTANRSPSLPQLSHNSRTSLSLFWVSPPRRIRTSIRMVQLRYDGDKHVCTYVRTYLFPFCMYVLLQRSPVGTILYHLNTVGIRPRGALMKRQEPHISDTGYRRSPQQVAQESESG